MIQTLSAATSESPTVTGVPGSVPRWRRDRDSNPGDGFPPTRVPGVRLRPLGHLSARNSLASPAIVSQENTYRIIQVSAMPSGNGNQTDLQLAITSVVSPNAANRTSPYRMGVQGIVVDPGAMHVRPVAKANQCAGTHYCHHLSREVPFPVADRASPWPNARYPRSTDADRLPVIAVLDVNKGRRVFTVARFRTFSAHRPSKTFVPGYDPSINPKCLR